MLHDGVELNSKMVSNAVLPPCQSRTQIMNLVRHDNSTAFETGLKRPWGGRKGISVVSTILSYIFIFRQSVMDFLGLKRVILLFVCFLWSSHILQSDLTTWKCFFGETTRRTENDSLEQTSL